jgi:hypothetical protein
MKSTEHSKHMHRKTQRWIECIWANTQPVSRGRGGLETNMVLPAHTVIEDTESADKAAKETLHEEPAREIRATEHDWFKWQRKRKEINGWHPKNEW